MTAQDDRAGVSAVPSLPASKGWVLAVTSGASLMAALDAMVVATSLGAIRSQFGTDLTALQWTLNAYNLSFAVLLLTCAALGDRFGRRRLFSLGVALFVAASVICALSSTVPLLIAGRAAQGVGAAFLMPLAMALLSSAYPPAERGKALGVFSGVTGLGIIAGPLLGGAISEGLAWQWIFWINVPIGLVILALTQRHVAESFGPRERIDLIGVVLVTFAALGIVWAIQSAPRLGWQDASVVSSLAMGLALAVSFILWERRANNPMVPLRMFGSRAFSTGIVVSFLFYASMYGMVFFLPQFFQMAQGHGALGAGARLLPWTATLFFVAPVAGRMIARLGERHLLGVGVCMQAAGFALLALLAEPGTPFVQLLVPLAVAGAGVSMAMPAAQNLVLTAVDRSAFAKAAGIFNMFRFLGGASGIALSAAAFASVGTAGHAVSFADGFRGAAAASAAMSFLAALLTLAGPRRSVSASER